MQDFSYLNCTKCGECCRHIKHIPALTHFANKEGICIHLKGNICDIYETRPDICNYIKAYHRYFSHIRQEKYYELVTKSCMELQKIAHANQYNKE